MKMGMDLEESRDTIAFATSIVTGGYLKDRSLVEFLTAGAIKAEFFQNKMNL